MLWHWQVVVKYLEDFEVAMLIIGRFGFRDFYFICYFFPEILK